MKKNAGKREKGGKIDAPRSGKAAKSINQKFFLINIDPNIFRHLFFSSVCLGKGKKYISKFVGTLPSLPPQITFW